jgi:hypothetical protein
MRLSDPPRALRQYAAVYVIAGLALVTMGAGAASCTKQQEAAVASDLSAVGACVLTHAQAGEDPLQVLGSCAGTTVENVVKIVETFLAAQPQPDAGTVGAQRDVLKAFLAKAKALQAAPGKP